MRGCPAAHRIDRAVEQFVANRLIRLPGDIRLPRPRRSLLPLGDARVRSVRLAIARGASEDAASPRRGAIGEFYTVLKQANKRCFSAHACSCRLV
jgi:hypothetical protein